MPINRPVPDDLARLRRRAGVRYCTSAPARHARPIPGFSGLWSEATLIHFKWYGWPWLAEQHMSLNASFRPKSCAAFSTLSRKSVLSFPGSGSNSPQAPRA